MLSVNLPEKIKKKNKNNTVKMYNENIQYMNNAHLLYQFTNEYRCYNNTGWINSYILHNINLKNQSLSSHTAFRNAYGGSELDGKFGFVYT